MGYKILLASEPATLPLVAFRTNAALDEGQGLSGLPDEIIESDKRHGGFQDQSR
jgi:hypothetical protein